MKDLMNAIAHVDRPQLGDQIPVSVFRVFRQFSALHAEDILGTNGTKIVFRHAGRQLGLDVGKSMLSEDLDTYLGNIIKFIKDTGIGILSMELDDKGQMIFRLDECITCAGMPSIGQKICHFEVGIVAGAVEAFVGNSVIADETKCNANGDDCCEVTVTL